jgi:hypothetical protein
MSRQQSRSNTSRAQSSLSACKSVFSALAVEEDITPTIIAPIPSKINKRRTKPVYKPLDLTPAPIAPIAPIAPVARVVRNMRGPMAGQAIPVQPSAGPRPSGNRMVRREQIQPIRPIRQLNQFPTLVGDVVLTGPIGSWTTGVDAIKMAVDIPAPEPVRRRRVKPATIDNLDGLEVHKLSQHQAELLPLLLQGLDHADFHSEDFEPILDWLNTLGVIHNIGGIPYYVPHAHIKFTNHHDRPIDHNSFLPLCLHHVDPRDRHDKPSKPRRARFVMADIDETFPPDDEHSGPWIEVF